MSADPTGMISDDAVQNVACSVCGANAAQPCVIDDDPDDPSDVDETEWGVHSDRIWDYRDACRQRAAKIAASRRSEK